MFTVFFAPKLQRRNGYINTSFAANVTLGTENAVHSTCVFTPVIPYCRRAEVIVGGPFKKTEAVEDISGKPTTLALHVYFPAVSSETVTVKFDDAPTTCEYRTINDKYKYRFLSVLIVLVIGKYSLYLFVKCRLSKVLINQSMVWEYALTSATR